MYNGLSLDQAPPISVVMRFFLTAPLFGIMLGCFLFTYPHEILTPSHPLSLIAIHLTFLGVITMAMMGALFQMQSVLGGRPIPAPAGNGFIIHLFLSIGLLALIAGFVLSQPVLFVIASILLGASLLYTVTLVLPLLFKGSAHDTIRGMRFAIIFLALAVFLGIIMASEYANESFSPSHELIRSLHYSFGLIGWVAMLIIAVAFQVVEMFYVTPSFSPWCKRNAFVVLSAALIGKTIWLIFRLAYGWVFDLVIGALLIGFVATTTKRVMMRKRRVSDVSIWFWIGAMGLLLVSLLSNLVFGVTTHAYFQTLSLITFALFALSIILGMIGKIVPFLVWFHLNSSGYMDAPIMSNIIPISLQKALFGLFAMVSVALMIGVFFAESFVVGAIAAIVMFSLLLFNLINALKLYRHTLIHGTRFEQI